MRDLFFEGYIECALWSSNDDKGGPLDQTLYELSKRARETMFDDCAEFWNANRDLLEQAMAEGRGEEALGHDFWLTRNHHGVGFWDGRLSDALGKALTDAAHKVGECDLFVSDAGEIEVG